MSNVIPFTGATLVDLPADQILEGAKGELDTCVIFGVDKDGYLYTASSTSNVEAVNYLIDMVKHQMFE